jgi:hypothetical protein
MLKRRWLAIPLVCCLGAAPAMADDIRPEARALSEAIPMAADKCMQDAGGDDGKVQVCDDKYSECLQQCEGG